MANERPLELATPSTAFGNISPGLNAGRSSFVHRQQHPQFPQEVAVLARRWAWEMNNPADQLRSEAFRRLLVNAMKLVARHPIPITEQHVPRSV
jgi:hypothetical protein